MSQTTTPSGADVLKLIALVNAASPGPWETDVIKCDGEYGDGGPNGRSGYMAEQMHDANGVAIFDSLNSEGALIDEDVGEESVYAWDVVANRNFEAVAAAMSFIREHGTAVAALIARNAELEALANERMRAVNAWATANRECAERACEFERERDALAAENKALREVTDEMVENAARARCTFFGWNPDGHVTYAGTKKVCKKPDGYPLLQWEFCKEETHAALTAALARTPANEPPVG